MELIWNEKMHKIKWVVSIQTWRRSRASPPQHGHWSVSPVELKTLLKGTFWKVTQKCCNIMCSQLLWCEAATNQQRALMAKKVEEEEGDKKKCLQGILDGWNRKEKEKITFKERRRNLEQKMGVERGWGRRNCYTVGRK